MRDGQPAAMAVEGTSTGNPVGAAIVADGEAWAAANQDSRVGPSHPLIGLGFRQRSNPADAIEDVWHGADEMHAQFQACVWFLEERAVVGDIARGQPGGFNRVAHGDLGLNQGCGLVPVVVQAPSEFSPHIAFGVLDQDVPGDGRHQTSDQRSNQ